MIEHKPEVIQANIDKELELLEKCIVILEFVIKIKSRPVLFIPAHESKQDGK